MTRVKKVLPGVGILAALAMVATLGLVPLGARGADHLDAPGLTSPDDRPQLDINDLYVFEGENPDNTVLALTVNPLAAGDTDFATWREGSYHVRIDQMDPMQGYDDEDGDDEDGNDRGDVEEDVTYSVRFADKRSGDGQWVIVTRARGDDAQDEDARGRVIGFGSTEDTIPLRGGGWFFAGLRSDPFFFDLGGFLGSVEGAANDRALNDGKQVDFFDGLNTLAIVIEVPDARVGGQVGVWATTSGRDDDDFSQVDRMGRPAINTAVNSSGPLVDAPSEAKNVYNRAHPDDDVEDFTDAVVRALRAYSSLGTQYTPAEAQALAAVLLPDVLTYDTSTAASGPLNGRALADDVIDVELGILTNGAVTTDGIGPHTDYLASFPYLGLPH